MTKSVIGLSNFVGLGYMSKKISLSLTIVFGVAMQLTRPYVLGDIRHWFARASLELLAGSDLQNGSRA
ncbi:hypothetical protein HYDPIDRAFT_117759 [Hydnomerulius pinastri MD-312]|uniref:Uncharacterized protein n=1 Tax=Hydnomerulius pinastri MD-312 TaxID=994086 RepID=A0A0C9W274_9AGAM|nr:hypothetical protein HYDPIDRAFT_117759 [Hydnomerulius pinastri MD-312]